MKTALSNLTRLSILLLLLPLSWSCSKSDDSQDQPASFTWTWNGTNYTGNFKEAFLTSLGPNPIIITGTGSSLNSLGTGPRFTVNSLNTGTYNLGMGPNNYISFFDPNGDNLSSTVGTLNITANANNKLSGNFSATLINAASQTSTISGSFSNIKINQ